MKKLYSLLIIQLFLCSFTSNLSWGLGTQSTFKAKPSSPNRLTELTSEAKKLGSKVKTSLNKNKKSILGFTFLLTLSCLTLTFFGLSAFIAFGMISLPSYTFYILIVLATIVSIPLILIIVIVSKAYDAMQNKINNSRSSSSSIKIYPQYIFILIISIINILLTLITFIFSILFFNNLLSVAVGATLIGASILMALLLTAFIVYSITIVLISKPRNNTSEFLSKPITQVVSNIIFLSIFTCSVLMIFNIIPIAAPIFSYLPYILLSISVLFYLINIPFLLKLDPNKQQSLEINYYLTIGYSKKTDLESYNTDKTISKKTYAFSAITAFQSLLFLTTAIIIFTFHTSFATITLPVIFVTFSFILSVLTIIPVILLGRLLYVKTFEFKKFYINSNTPQNCFKLIKHNIRALRKIYSRLNADPAFLTKQDQYEIHAEKNKLRKFLKRKEIQRRFTEKLDSLTSKLYKDLISYKETYQETLEPLIKEGAKLNKKLNCYKKIKVDEIIRYFNNQHYFLSILRDNYPLYVDLNFYFDLSKLSDLQTIKKGFENKFVSDPLNRSA